MKKYLIRLNYSDSNMFELYALNKNLSYVCLSYDYVGGKSTVLYSVTMDMYSAIELKLSIPMSGCMTFNSIAV